MRPEPSSPPIPSTSPARRSKSTPSSTRRQPCRAGTSSVRPRTDSTTRPGRRAAAGAAGRVSRPTIAAMMPVAAHLADRRGHHVAPVAQHRDPVGQLRSPRRCGARCRRSRRPRAASCRTMRNSRAHSAGDSAEVGSSMIRIRASSDSALAISTSCCSPTRRPADPRLRVELDPEPGEQPPRRRRPSPGGRGTRRRSAARARGRCCAATLSSGTRFSSWWMIATPARSASRTPGEAHRSPPIRTSPA